MAELKMDNNDGNTVRPDPLYFFLEPQIRCLKTHWKRTGWNAFSSNSCSVYARPSIFLLPNRHASQFHALSALRARASAD